MQDSSIPPIRRWAARILLLMACIGSVATEPALPPYFEEEVQGQPLTLTQARPTAQRRLRIQVSEDRPSPRQLGLMLSTRFTARWLPEAPDSTAVPSLRVRLIPPPGFDGGAWEAPLHRLERDTSGSLGASASALACTPQSDCEWSATLEFELLTHEPGSVEVEWTAFVDTRLPEGTKWPAGFQLSLTEE